jgi:hypothetical protein
MKVKVTYMHFIYINPFADISVRAEGIPYPAVSPFKTIKLFSLSGSHTGLHQGMFMTTQNNSRDDFHYQHTIPHILAQDMGIYSWGDGRAHWARLCPFWLLQ